MLSLNQKKNKYTISIKNISETTFNILKVSNKFSKYIYLAQIYRTTLTDRGRVLKVTNSD